MTDPILSRKLDIIIRMFKIMVGPCDCKGTMRECKLCEMKRKIVDFDNGETK